MNGYCGKILWVDLTYQTWQEESLPDALYQRVLSGGGLGVHLLLERMPAGAHPLGADNILAFVAGILVGSGAMFAGRWMVVGKSPLTGGWGDSNCGGNFAPAIKQCGYDGIFFTGAAPQPVYLFIDGQTVEFHSAADLWGLDAVMCEQNLSERHGRKARTACIGTAGEKRALIAGIVNDRGRIAARSGLGAVMGSKNLKAVVLAGSQPVRTAQPEEIRRLSKSIAGLMPKGEPPLRSWMLPIAGWLMSKSRMAFRKDGLMTLPPLRKWGTASGNEVAVQTGDAPLRNWRGEPSGYPSSAISADALIRSERRKYHCYACPLGCGGINDLDGEYTETHRPEYETTAALGPLLGNTDLDTIFYLNELFNRAGMDSISAGTTLAFALHCFEAGLIGESDTGGLRLTWGNAPAIRCLAEQMVHRKGFGDLLADGVRLAAERIGRGSDAFAMHIGGQELPMHDPRLDPGYGILYAGDPTPARHNTGSHLTYELLRLWSRVSWAPPVPPTYNSRAMAHTGVNNGLKMAACAMAKSVIDGGGFCTFGAHMGVDNLALFEYLNAATGWQYSPDEYMEIGRQVQSMRMRFNLKHGIQPARLNVPPLIYGASSARRAYDLYALRAEFWQAMGWDAASGAPPEVNVGG